MVTPATALAAVSPSAGESSKEKKRKTGAVEAHNGKVRISPVEVLERENTRYGRPITQRKSRRGGDDGT